MPQFCHSHATATVASRKHRARPRAPPAPCTAHAPACTAPAPAPPPPRLRPAPACTGVRAGGRRQAIAWAWELFTEVYGLPVDRFYATYFEGDESLGLAPDEEARQLWLKFLPEVRRWRNPASLPAATC